MRQLMNDPIKHRGTLRNHRRIPTVTTAKFFESNRRQKEATRSLTGICFRATVPKVGRKFMSWAAAIRGESTSIQKPDFCIGVMSVQMPVQTARADRVVMM